jgi:hypothetical protein
MIADSVKLPPVKPVAYRSTHFLITHHTVGDQFSAQKSCAAKSHIRHRGLRQKRAGSILSFVMLTGTGPQRSTMRVVLHQAAVVERRVAIVEQGGRNDPDSFRNRAFPFTIVRERHRARGF